MTSDYLSVHPRAKLKGKYIVRVDLLKNKNDETDKIIYACLDCYATSTSHCLGLNIMCF